MTVGIRASVATCGNNLEDTMAGSQIEEVGAAFLMSPRQGETSQHGEYGGVEGWVPRQVVERGRRTDHAAMKS